MVPVPLQQYQSVAQGQKFKAVTCENCQVEYFYLLTRQAEGWAAGVKFLDVTVADRATRRANAGLRRALARAKEPVPCPACGWYQKDMLPLVRQQWLR